MIQNIAKSQKTNKSKRPKDEEYTENKKGRKQPTSPPPSRPKKQVDRMEITFHGKRLCKIVFHGRRFVRYLGICNEFVSHLYS